jgi:hypothetical protein
MKDTQKTAESTAATDKKFEGFTDEERGAMKERAQELKAAARRGPRADKADGEAPCSRRSPRCRNRIVSWASGSMPSSKPARQPSRRDSGTGCPRMPTTARSSASSKARRSSKRDTRLWLQRQGEPRRRRHVARRLRAEGVDYRRRGKDRHAREESSGLRTELTSGLAPRRDSRSGLAPTRSGMLESGPGYQT